jgi:hypothetical protein
VLALPSALLGTNMPDVTQARCLIEDATAELDLAKLELTSNQANQPGQDNTYRKFRVTAEVRGPGPGGERVARMQSEIRMTVN